MKYIKILLVGSLLLPVIAFAAFDDVGITTDAVINVGAYSLNISGSTAAIESITVNDSNFTVTLAAGSAITVYSSSFNDLSTDAAGATVVDTCNATASSINLTYAGAGSVTHTITPSSGICGPTGVSTPASSNTSSSSGGGSGGYYVAPTPTPSVSLAQPANCPAGMICTATATTGVGGVTSGLKLFTKTLAFGIADIDVRALQVFLNTHGFVIANSGSGSPGNETSYFGNGTKAALVKYQASVGLPGTGFFGPLTIAKVNSVILGGATVPIKTVAPTTTSSSFGAGYIFNKNLTQGDTDSDVMMLQKYLNSNEYVIAESGIGSSGNESDYFGSLTKTALMKFQANKGLPSTGFFGPMTRGVINK
ncbi:MAG: peptidoglycan-binding domain-containing protein [Candidatus Paceibacterota bacterium]|jgi:peptidoglycan hydrolase-like protein with peptidoglycan-binding domain